MEVTGIYESLITRVLQEKLEVQHGDYHVEKGSIDASEAAVRLSGFLNKIIH